MSDKKEAALEAKSRGNAAFKEGNFEKAIEEFSKGIELDPTNHVLFSNRSGAFLSLNKTDDALKDAEQCIKIKPDWAKGFSRKGAALLRMRNFDEAKTAYEGGLKVDSNNRACKEGLSNISSQSQQFDPFGQMFGPDMLDKLRKDKRTSTLMEDPSFVSKMEAIQKNPKTFATQLGDPGVATAFQVLLNLPANLGSMPGMGGMGGMGGGMGGMGGPGGPGGFGGSIPGVSPGSNPFQNSGGGCGSECSDPHCGPPKTSAPPKSAPEPKPEVKRELTEEEKADLKLKEEADALKEQGNAEFKDKKYTEALGFYEKAVEKYPKSPIYHNNIATVHYALKDYEKCVAACDKAVEVGNEFTPGDFDALAKAHARKGYAFYVQREWKSAVAAFRESLVNAPNRKVEMTAEKAERLLEEAERKAYINPDLALEHKQKGNGFVKESKWPEAIKEYTEAIKRDPSVAAFYANRAHVYMKIMQWGRAMEDCDKCLELDNTYVKAYIRKGKVQHFLKQYHKALETYEAGLKLHPENRELAQGYTETQMAVQEANYSGEVDQDRAREAMRDPEIQRIVRDPTIQKVLEDMQRDPSVAQKVMADPELSGKIRKLVQAGILKVR